MKKVLRQKPKWSGLETEIYHQMKDNKLIGKRCLVAVSGGLDSIALLHILSRLKSALRLELAIGHVHHGDHSSKRQLAFRDRAQELVYQTANHLGLEFHVLRLQIKATSEADLRHLRHAALSEMMKNAQADKTAFAHHSDDLLETRLIRLIRGVGAEGLPSMSLSRRNIVRPLLHQSRASLELHAQEHKLKWVEDPSNSSNGPLRNWIRHNWLPQLEKKRSGSGQALARSLHNLAHRPNQKWINEVIDQNGIRRAGLLALDQGAQKQVLATYLKNKGSLDYSSAHVFELLKRLDTSKKELTFRLSRRNWKVNAEYIVII